MQANASRDFQFGIEEEYFLACADRRDTTKRPPRRFLEAARKAFPDAVQSEMLQSQIEVATRPLVDFDEARIELSVLRSSLGGMARQHGLSLFAAGTHPLALWSRQRQTDALRYEKVMHDLQMLGFRNMVCGLHVHVEVPDPDSRIDLMIRVLPYVPLLLALSTSSPFWQARRTGLMGYRLAAYDELPRTGLPDLFETAADYHRYVETLVAARVIENASFIWWVVRPSLKHPTLELRVADSCTRLEDTLGIAALFRVLLRYLSRNPTLHADMKPATRAIVAENKWRAQRYGIHGSFVDEGTQGLVSVRKHFETVLDSVRDDAVALGCTGELEALGRIFERGTSADMQVALFTEAVGRGAPAQEALSGVVDWLAQTTAGGAEAPALH
jgi:glutamate---cysteine ligase / carboxylate-amine ligase